MMVDEAVFESEGRLRPASRARTWPINPNPKYVIVIGSGRLQRILATIVISDTSVRVVAPQD
jgi:hypothetical protein